VSGTGGRAAAPDAPAAGTAPLVEPNAARLLRRNETEHADRPAVLTADLTWTYADYVAECRRFAALFRRWRPDGKPFHVGVLLDNTPAYLAALGGAALAGATVVGLNPTRQGDNLAHDANHVDLCALITEPRHAPLLDPIRGQLDVDLIRVVGDDLDPDLASVTASEAAVDEDPDVDATWVLVFTSGTTTAPKAVICSQRRLLVTGERMRQMLSVEADDVGYLCMPLFHSNSLMVGWMPAMVAGAAVALAPRFSASGWLPDVRRYGVTYWNYTGKPLAYLLATEERPDDADNPLRRAYGNEGSDTTVEAFARRFGVEVLDAFGPTEGGIGIVRGPDDPPGSLGHSGGVVKVLDADMNECPVAEFDASGRLTNADVAVGELVNTSGPGPFEGYYNNPEATAKATRNGWYWSGDLGYADAQGYVYFAGRTADWLRVDGENFPTGPIENAVARHADVFAAAVYGVPDAEAGDQVMATLVLRDAASFDPTAFAEWIDAQPDLGPKWRPRFVRLTKELPRTPTHKVLHRQLQHEKFRSDLVADDPVFHRPRGAASYEPFDAAAEDALRAQFAKHNRERFWDL
jgi:acyl-CoA synthetase (AMP-forming)/AMP-acid ligase II